MFQIVIEYSSQNHTVKRQRYKTEKNKRGYAKLSDFCAHNNNEQKNSLGCFQLTSNLKMRLR